MKKRLFILALVLLILNNSLPVIHAKETNNKPLTNERYVTTEDVLLTLLSSDIDNFVKDNYSKTKQNYSITKVEDVEFNSLHVNFY